MGRVMSGAAMNNGTDGGFSRGNKAAVIVSPPRFEEPSSVMLTCKHQQGDIFQTILFT